MNNSLNEYFLFNFELNQFLARFNVKMNNQNLSPTPTSTSSYSVVSLKLTECEPFAHEGGDHCALPRGWEDSPWSCICIQRLDTEKELVVPSSVDKIWCCREVAREAVELRSLPEMGSFWSSWCSVALPGRCSVAQSNSLIDPPVTDKRPSCHTSQ